MKFRDKNGNMFEDIIDVLDAYCFDVFSRTRSYPCFSCPMQALRGGDFCGEKCRAYPAEAARLMGYAVVEDDEE